MASEVANGDGDQNDRFAPEQLAELRALGADFKDPEFIQGVLGEAGTPILEECVRQLGFVASKIGVRVVGASMMESPLGRQVPAMQFENDKGESACVDMARVVDEVLYIDRERKELGLSPEVVLSPEALAQRMAEVIAARAKVLAVFAASRDDAEFRSRLLELESKSVEIKVGRVEGQKFIAEETSGGLNDIGPEEVFDPRLDLTELMDDIEPIPSPAELLGPDLGEAIDVGDALRQRPEGKS